MNKDKKNHNKNNVNMSHTRGRILFGGTKKGEEKESM